MWTFALVALMVFGLSATYAQEQGATQAPSQREMPMMRGMMGGMMGGDMRKQMSRMMENCNKMMEGPVQERQQPPQNR
jgi:hypothetical protein